MTSHYSAAAMSAAERPQLIAERAILIYASTAQLQAAVTN